MEPDFRDHAAAMLDGSLVQFARHVIVLVSPQSCAMPSGGWVFNRISHLMDSCSNHYINPNRKNILPV